MIKKTLAILFVFLVMRVGAQQTAQYTQYYFNNFGYNPAFAGATGCIDFTFGGKYQWLGFKGAPHDLFVSVHGTKPTKFYTTKGKFGFGGYVEQDRVHLTTRNIFKFALAYHKRLFGRTNGAAGIFAGLEQFAIDNVFGNFNADPVLNNAGGTKLLYPEFMPGVLLYNNRMYFGISINQFINVHNTKLGGGDHKLRNQYYVTYMHKSFVNDWVIFKSILLKMGRLTPPAADVNVSWEYRKKITFGVGYRVGEAATANLKFRLFGNLQIGYAFDFPLNKVRVASAYSHEIMIRFSKCPGDGEGAPRGKIDKVACPAF